MQTSKSKQKSTSATPAKPSPGQKNKNNKQSTTPGKKRATPAAEPQANTTQTLAKKIESVRRVTNWPADEDILRVLQESNFRVEVAIDKILSGDAGHPGQQWTEVTYQKKPKETAPEEKKAAGTPKQDRPQRSGGRGSPATGPKNGRTNVENGKDRREPRDQRRDQRPAQKPITKTGGRGAPPRSTAGRGVSGQDATYHANASHSALQASALAATVTPGQTFAARVAQSSQNLAPPPVPASTPAEAVPQDTAPLQGSVGNVGHSQTPVARPSPSEQPSVDLHALATQPPPLQPQTAPQPQTLAQHQPQTQTQRPLTPPQAQPASSPLAPQEPQLQPSDYAPQAQVQSPTTAKPAAGVAPLAQGPIGSPSQGKASQQFAKGSRRGEAHWKPVQKKESLPAHAPSGITQPRPQEASLPSIGSDLGLMQGAGEPEQMTLLESGQDVESFFPETFDRKDAPFQFGNFGLAPGHKEESPSAQIRQDTAPARQAQPVRSKEKDQLETAAPQPQAQPQPQAAGAQNVPRKRSTDKKQQPQYRSSAAPQLTDENLHLMSGGALGGPYPYGHFPFMPQVVPYPLDLSDPAVQAQAHPQMFYDQSQFQGSNTYRTTSTVAPDASKYHAPSAYREGKYTPHAPHQAQGAAATQAQTQDRERTTQSQPSPQSPPPVHQAQQPPPAGYLPGTSQYPIYAYPYQFTYPAAPAAGSQYAYAGQRMPYYKTYGSGSGYPVSPPGSSSHGVSAGAYTEDVAQDFAGKYQQSQYYFPGEPQLPTTAQGAAGAGKTLTHGQAAHQHQTTTKTQQQQHAQTQGTQLAYAPPDLPAAYKADYSAAPGGATATTAADGQGRGSPGLSMGHAGSSYYSPQAYPGHYAQGHQAYAYLQQHPQPAAHPHAHLLQAQGQAPPGQASQFS